LDGCCSAGNRSNLTRFEDRGILGGMMKRTPEQRFWSKVRKTRGCWLWTGGTDGQQPEPYARIRVNGRRVGIHVYSWFLKTGQWTKLWILHKCDTPLCVNPIHLFEGTCADNSRDCAAKGRNWHQQVTRCPRGHKYTKANTYFHPQRGTRDCRFCLSRKRRDGGRKK